MVDPTTADVERALDLLCDNMDDDFSLANARRALALVLAADRKAHAVDSDEMAALRAKIKRQAKEINKLHQARAIEVGRRISDAHEALDKAGAPRISELGELSLAGRILEATAARASDVGEPGEGDVAAVAHALSREECCGSMDDIKSHPRWLCPRHRDEARAALAVMRQRFAARFESEGAADQFENGAHSARRDSYGAWLAAGLRAVAAYVLGPQTPETDAPACPRIDELVAERADALERAEKAEAEVERLMAKRAEYANVCEADAKAARANRDKAWRELHELGLAGRRERDEAVRKMQAVEARGERLTEALEGTIRQRNQYRAQLAAERRWREEAERALANERERMGEVVDAMRPYAGMEGRWYAYDHECGYETYDTAAEARESAAHSMEQARDGDTGWHENTEDIEWGRIIPVQRAVQTVYRAATLSERARYGFDECWEFELKDVAEVALADAELAEPFKRQCAAGHAIASASPSCYHPDCHVRTPDAERAEPRVEAEPCPVDDDQLSQWDRGKIGATYDRMWRTLVWLARRERARGAAKGGES